MAYLRQLHTQLCLGKWSLSRPHGVGASRFQMEGEIQRLSIHFMDQYAGGQEAKTIKASVNLPCQPVITTVSRTYNHLRGLFFLIVKRLLYRLVLAMKLEGHPPWDCTKLSSEVRARGY